MIEKRFFSPIQGKTIEQLVKAEREAKIKKAVDRRDKIQRRRTKWTNEALAIKAGTFYGVKKEELQPPEKSKGGSLAEREATISAELSEEVETPAVTSTAKPEGTSSQPSTTGKTDTIISYRPDLIRSSNTISKHPFAHDPADDEKRGFFSRTWRKIKESVKRGW
ncbi:MAG: hypothetical protein WC768_02040 [Patescibacteria group bacterium]|jgi:hypothetical protein